ncbi:histidine kinase [Bacillus sp. AK128]
MLASTILFALVSFIIAFLGVFAALYLARRSQHSHSWLIGAAITLGLSIACMHFVGMLAIHDHVFTYNMLQLILSIVIAVITSYGGLYLLSKPKQKISILAFAGVLIGGGVLGLHYVALLAIDHMELVFKNNSMILVLIGIGLFAVAGVLVGNNPNDQFIRNSLLGSFFFSIGTVSVHYFNMHEISEHQHTVPPIPFLEYSWAILGITFSIIFILFLVLINVAYLDRKYGEQVAYNTAISEANHYLNFLLESIPNGVVVLSPRGAITFINRIGKEILFLSEEDVTGKSYTEPIWSFYTPDGQPLSIDQRPFSLISHTKRPIKNMEVLYKKNGKEPVLLSLNGIPYFNQNNEVQEIVLSFTDITNNRQQELELIEKSHKIEAMFNNTSFGIALLDHRGRIVEANPILEDLLGYSRDELSRFSEKYFIGKIVPKGFDVKEGERYYQVERRFFHKDGTSRWAKLTISVLPEPIHSSYILCIMEDITKTREMEISHLLKDAELRVLQAQINPHFLFNTLNSIVSLIRVKPECARHITVQLANFMRLNLNYSSIDLVPLVKELQHVHSYLEIIKIRFEDQIELVIDIAEDVNPELFLIPPFTIQPLIENCLEHGLLSRRIGGVVKVSITTRHGGVLVSIEDNGTGIHKNILDRLGHEKVSSKEGNGVGMYNVNQRLLMLIGLKAGLHISNIPEGGASISFFLPETVERMEAI